MSGHSKWNNIKRKKEKTDGQRAKIFTKIGREMSVCVKAGGGDPNVNTKLRDLIAKAKSMNVPNDNIQRIIKKAEGGEKDDYESITYEGYGPSGVAMMVETLTTATARRPICATISTNSAATWATRAAWAFCSASRALSFWTWRARTRRP